MIVHSKVYHELQTTKLLKHIAHHLKHVFALPVIWVAGPKGCGTSPLRLKSARRK